MIFDIFRHFWKLILHIFFITFLEKSKDHFCSPPAPKFALKCKFNFPIFLNSPDFFIFDFILLFLRDITTTWIVWLAFRVRTLYARIAACLQRAAHNNINREAAEEALHLEFKSVHKEPLPGF